MRGLTDEEASELRCATEPLSAPGSNDADESALRIIDRLEARGLVRWHDHPDDPDETEFVDATERGRLTLRIYDMLNVRNAS